MLEPAQEQLLTTFVEVAHSVPREQLQSFFIFRTDGPDILSGPGNFRPPPSAQHYNDVQVLADNGYVRATPTGSGGALEFFVTPEGYDYVRGLKQAAGEAQVEADIRRYLDSDAFGTKYPHVNRLWSDAADLLWGENWERELTTIGHKTREAVQAFATALVSQHQPPDVDPDPAHTVARLRAVIAERRQELGEARSHLLDALVVYWGETNDLLQRQEHGGQREGEPLNWEDGRRAVFHTAIVMYEIDRTL
jgi:hypothetical protein